MTILPPPILKHFLPFLLICIISAAFMFHYISLDSWTTDEPLHIQSGIEWITQHQSPTDPFNPPLAKLLYGIISSINPDLLFDPNLLLERSVSVILALILLAVVYTYSNHNFGPRVAIMATLLLAFEPVFLAYGHLATTDIWASLFFFLSIISLSRVRSSSFPLLFILSANALLATKMIYLPVILLLALSSSIFRHSITKANTLFKVIITTIAFQLLIYGPQPVAILGSSFSIPLGELINTFLHALSYIFNPKFAATKRLIYFGQLNGQGWFTYPIVALLLKTSPLLIILGFLGLINRPKSTLTIASLLLLVLVTLGRYSIGIRQLLPLYPLLAIQAAIYLHPKITHQGLIIILATGLIIQTATINDPIAYFTPIVGSELGGQIISDSNLNWGQSFYRLLKHPIYPHLDYISPTTPQNTKHISSTPHLPPNAELSAQLLAQKTIAISRTNWYKLNYFSNPLFSSATKTPIINHTYYLFTFD